MPFTDTILKSKLKVEREKVLEESDGDNLWVRFTKKGKITFFYRFREEGAKNPTRLDIGEYPYITLKQARIKAAEFNEQRKYGKNPKYELKLQQIETLNRMTVEQVIRFWYERDGHKKDSGPQIIRSFELHVFPLLKGIHHDDLTTNAWLVLLEQVAENIPSIASRLLTNIKLAQKLCMRRGIITNHSLQHITAKADLGISKNKKERNLSDQEIYWVIHAMMLSSRMHPKLKAQVLVLLMLGCRIGETRLALKEHIDFDKNVWTVPPDNHKTGELTKRAIVRPLIPAMQRLLRQVIQMSAPDKKYLFGYLSDTQDGPVGDTSHLTTPIRIIEQVKKVFGVDMQPWSMHDLRRTMRTHMSEFAPPYICEMMLGHALPDTWGTYDYFDYLDAQAKGYQLWYERLVEILNSHEKYDTSHVYADSNGSNPSLSRFPVSSSHLATLFLG